MSVLLPRFLAHQQAPSVVEGRRGRAPKAAAVVEVVNPGAGLHADPIRLRGIPVVGGCSGTSPGTDPLRALVSSDERRYTHGR